jgi:predicted dehydrogenase
VNTTNRRAFLQTAAGAALAADRMLGANDRVNLLIVGLGGRGRDHINFYSELPEARIGAVCDVDQAAQERAVAQVEKAQGHKPVVYSDMRKAFEDKEIDAVSIATPNHWHALSAIWAMQAGKDVYVEKPASHNIFEGRQMVAAARKYKRMVQVGSQSRTIQHKFDAMKLLEEGVIGKVYLAKGLCYKRRKSIGRQPDGPVPPGVNWDLFLGPAPMRAFNPNRFKYNWHWFWDTGNGDIGNQGVHEMDICKWGLGKTTLPKSVISTGGKFVYDDDQETPNTQLATFDWGDVQAVFEVRGLLTDGDSPLQYRGGNTIGNIFYGSDGYMAIDNMGFQVYKGESHEKVMDEKFKEKRSWDTAPHMANFLAAVKSRNQKDLHAEIAIGADAAAMCHLANISYRLKRKLEYDPAKMQFVNDIAANKMLTRPYRAPYVVPTVV